MIRIFESVQRVSICNILCTIKNGGLHMRKMGKHIPGLIVTLVVLITAIVFAVMLLNMKVIPTKFIAVIGLVMLVLIVIVGALVWSYVWYCKLRKYRRCCTDDHHDPVTA